MSAEGEAGTNRRGEPRVPFNGAVRLRYRLFHEFLEENAANISKGGMFIRTIHPGELGSEMEFEIRLEDDFTLIQGRGEVVWVRRPDQPPGAEPGMGIRFIALPDESRALVDKIVAERVAAGLELFDLESHAPASGQASGDRPLVTAETASDPAPIWELDAAGASPGAAARESAREAPAVENLAVLDPELPQSPRAASPAPAPPAVRPAGPGGRSGPVRLIAVAVLSAFLGAGAVVAFYLLYVQPSIDALETRIDELTGDPGGPWQPPAREPAPLVSEGGTQAAGGPPPASRPGQTPDDVDALRGWADAWTEQRADDYLAFYSADFVPPDGLGRAAWEESRRARIARPQWIRVALTLVQVEPAGPEEAEVRFVQSYRSERYKDLVRKRMRMVLEDGAWKVAAERVVSR